MTWWQRLRPWRMVELGTQIPTGWRIAWLRSWRQEGLALPFGVHWLGMLVHWLWHWSYWHPWRTEEPSMRVRCAKATDDLAAWKHACRHCPDRGAAVALRRLQDHLKAEASKEQRGHAPQKEQR